MPEGWEIWLKPVTDVSEGSAIISLGGVACCRKGDWNATTEEEQSYTSLMNNINLCSWTKLTYDGREFMIIRIHEDTVVGLAHHEKLVLQKTKSVYIAAHVASECIVSLNTPAWKVAQVAYELVKCGA
jgi:hypothetical protein